MKELKANSFSKDVKKSWVTGIPVAGCASSGVSPVARVSSGSGWSHRTAAGCAKYHSCTGLNGNLPGFSRLFWVFGNVFRLPTHKDFMETRVNAFVCDLTADDLSMQISPSSVDIVTMIFVLSAVSPVKMHLVLQNIRKVLKPNGYLLFRDYATGDLAQHRFRAWKKDFHRGKRDFVCLVNIGQENSDAANSKEGAEKEKF
ncbi:hypothetical protein U1Q18_017898 [Sarracenia purpurea var. burkii]